MRVWVLILLLSGILFAATQRNILISRLQKYHKLNSTEVSKITKIFEKASYLGQGNPAVTKHPVTRKQCLDKAKEAKIKYQHAEYESICGDPFMAPLVDTSRQRLDEAKVCIDQFEFPNIPCEFPIIWVRASEAQNICLAMGKRLCDAHEWEGACAGKLTPAEYAFEKMQPNMKDNQKQRVLRANHNKFRKVKWAYGDKQDHSLCATNSTKSPKCDSALASGKSVYENCGSNTYPAGYFHKCKSSFSVFDQHGNAAEHMNLPLDPKELTSVGGTGVVEMKGSWFIFAKYSAHRDDCRWRAPYWHGTRLMSEHSHHNYHLGFRCCKDIKPLVTK